MTVSVHVDADRCAGHGRCFALEPDLFDCDDAGYPVLLHDTVPAALEGAARDAAAGCPEGAISIGSGGVRS
jgi:ferredoxin